MGLEIQARVNTHLLGQDEWVQQAKGVECAFG